MGKCNTSKPGFFDFEGQRKWYVALILLDSKQPVNNTGK